MKKTLAMLLLVVFPFTTLSGCANPDANIVERYQKNIRPALTSLFTLYFGTYPNGTIRVKASKNPDPDGVVGIQEIVFQQFDNYTEEQKVRLRDANQRIVAFYKKAKKIDDQIMTNVQNARRIRRLLAQLSGDTDRELSDNQTVKAVSSLAGILTKTIIAIQ